MLDCQRHLFSLPADLHYLNCASRAPLLRAAEAAGVAGVQWQRVPQNIPPEEYFHAADELRGRIARLINAPADAVALTPSVSYGVAIAASQTPLRRGQNVVMPEQEFPSDVYPWMTLCAEDGAELRLVARPSGSPAAGTARAWNERLLEAIDADTAVVNLSAVHWTDGLRFDLAAIGERAREVGALFVVDGTQSVGADPFDFAAIQPDLLVGAGYKWLLGPYQIGFAAVGERLRAGRPFEQHWSNRAGSEDVRSTAYQSDYRPGARRYDVGEHANQITVPMLSEGVRQVLEWTPAAVQAYCAALRSPLEPLLAGEGFRALPAAEHCAHIIGLHAADEAALPRIMDTLRARNVRISQRGSVLRVSPHVYNTAEDVAALAEGLAAALR